MQKPPGDKISNRSKAEGSFGWRQGSDVWLSAPSLRFSTRAVAVAGRLVICPKGRDLTDLAAHAYLGRPV